MEKVKKLIALLRQADEICSIKGTHFLNDWIINDYSNDKNSIIFFYKCTDCPKHYCRFTQEAFEKSTWEENKLILKDKDGVKAELLLFSSTILTLEKDPIIVKVRGGVAYSDDTRVVIIDYDNEEDKYTWWN